MAEGQGDEPAKVGRKGAPCRGWASSPKLALLPQLLAEDEWGSVSFKIKGHTANLVVLTAFWDTFAELTWAHSISLESKYNPLTC